MDMTPKMYEVLEANGKALMGGVAGMIEAVFGEGYMPILILARDGNPDSLMILSELETKSQLMAVLRSAAARADTGEMLETGNAPKEH